MIGAYTGATAAPFQHRNVLPLLSGPIVRHTDGEREWACHRQSLVGKRDEASTRGWTVVGIKDDWKTVFPKQGLLDFPDKVSG